MRSAGWLSVSFLFADTPASSGVVGHGTIRKRTTQLQAEFDANRNNIQQGKIEKVEYESKVSGGNRKMNIYTPPGYTKDNKYPVLYLLHGIGGDENEWPRGGGAER